MTPQIILAFSNDKDNYLEMIVRERKGIFTSLQNFHDNGTLQVYKEENTSIDDIFETFNRYNNQIFIFHYGGHANGSYLQLEKGAGNTQLAHAAGLADLLGQQENLKLVFLNGCATHGQVDMLLKSGVKVVIATSVPINDEMAVDFSDQFYKKLAGDATIQEAFNFAKSYVSTKYGETRQISQHRDIDFEPVKNQSNELPWGLYFKNHNADILNWKLSEANKGQVPKDVMLAITDIRTRIAKNDTKRAIEIFKKISSKDPDLQNNINLLSASFNRNKNDEMMGLLSFSDAIRQYNIVNNSILQLLTSFEESFKN